MFVGAFVNVDIYTPHGVFVNRARPMLDPCSVIVNTAWSVMIEHLQNLLMIM